mmetsp:Transcript_32442/g.68004  ORF Transcript_32442/g.68004 Transcript_32442/m.68004 type:complete len:387 (+) Transcript_32442:30-1190(+)
MSLTAKLGVSATSPLPTPSRLTYRTPLSRRPPAPASLTLSFLCPRPQARSVKVPFEAEAPVAQLLKSLVAAFELPEETALRVLSKGKVVSGDPWQPCAAAGLRAGGVVMIMNSNKSDIEAVQNSKPERMRGFEEGDRRQATGGLGAAAAGSARAVTSRGASSQYTFHSLQPLSPLPPGAAPDASAALALLQKLSQDRAVLKLLEEHKWSIGRLSEMPPEGLVGVSASCLMGLNRNKGEEILLRLRTDDWAGLRPYLSLIDVLLHELAHCVHSEHDNDFKALWALLKMQYSQYRAAEKSARSAGASEVYQPQLEAAPTAHVLGGAQVAADVAPTVAAAAAAEARAASACGKAMIRKASAGGSNGLTSREVPVSPGGYSECDDCAMEE